MHSQIACTEWQETTETNASGYANKQLCVSLNASTGQIETKKWRKQQVCCNKGSHTGG